MLRLIYGSVFVSSLIVGANEVAYWDYQPIPRSLSAFFKNLSKPPVLHLAIAGFGEGVMLKPQRH